MDPRLQIALAVLSLIGALGGGFATVRASIGAKRLEVGTPSYAALDSRQERLEEKYESLRTRIVVVENEQIEDRRFIRAFIATWEAENPGKVFPVQYPLWYIIEQREKRLREQGEEVGYHD